MYCVATLSIAYTIISNLSTIVSYTLRPAMIPNSKTITRNRTYLNDYCYKLNWNSSYPIQTSFIYCNIRVNNAYEICRHNILVTLLYIRYIIRKLINIELSLKKIFHYATIYVEEYLIVVKEEVSLCYRYLFCNDNWKESFIVVHCLYKERLNCRESWNLPVNHSLFNIFGKLSNWITENCGWGDDYYLFITR